MSRSLATLPAHKPNLMLISLRINRGLSQRRLSYFTGVSAETIRLCEAGHRPGPRVMLDLASFLGVKPTDIWPLPGEGRTPPRTFA